MSKTNTIPEFLGIIAGTTLVISVLGVIIGVAYDEVKNKLKSNSNKIKPTKTKVDLFVRNEDIVKQDPLRYASGSPGETARILTGNFYTLFSGGTKNHDAALEFLKYRNSTFNALTGIELEENILKLIANKYYDQISTLIFFLCYHENHYGQTDVFTENIVNKIFKIILEEHNRVCPIGQEEINEFDMGLFLNIKSIYSKNNKIDNSSDAVGFEIFDDNGEIDNFDSDDDGLDYDLEGVDEEIDNFNDVDSNKDAILQWIDNIENVMVTIIEEFIPNNPMKNSPLEGMGILKKLIEISAIYKSQLIESKIELGFTDREIEYLISKAYSNVYVKYIDA